ncbi:hypothetical protein TVAG_393860 [Trichomonas vaginalis G3]|uniref:Translin-associated factor X-interacting protein 1 N-terminal domain-containing protein n=1 Tax=Trichomonas vaginalis (strain ATCC PRA-98 / G3) TaxID=412133 RepID=A2DWA3_TRIV3|nr:hypothetical protein TVAGG3_0279540 [Trichomonas vaginalis G3]EAY15243.1 hypothetical protein TVAG_393860 [Trichomonas vaginalis G3]KAI5526453.1 hypothetical protein TVAGG3_0279540 [Trichomonas vaginalis G3]|eukprot:XP_001327466.1 hypothetical protein [Trichomonas vaginalis G3]
MNLKSKTPRLYLSKPSKSQVIFVPNLLKTKRSIPLTSSEFNLHPKQELSQEQFISKLTEQLDEADSHNLTQEERFKVHQNFFNKLIDRFEVKNKPFTKIKQGYEAILNSLREQGTKTITVNNETQEYDDNFKDEIKNLQEKLVTKREKYKTLLASLNKLIADISSENQTHMRDIDTYKDANANLEIRKLNAEATYADLKARYQKKLAKYDKTLKYQRDATDKTKSLEVEIANQINNLAFLISDCENTNHEIGNIDVEVENINSQISQTDEEYKKLSRTIEEKEEYAKQLENEITELNDQIQNSRSFDENLMSQLYPVAKSLRLAARSISKMNNPTELLELCINKFREIENENNEDPAETEEPIE